MGKPELIEDERFYCNVERVKNHAQLKPILEEWLKNYTIDDAVAMILGVGVPAAPINTIDRVVADPHIAGSREMFVEMDHPKAGKIKIAGNQIKLSGTPVSYNRPAPLLGQHTEEILRELLGIGHEEYEKLAAEGLF
jgi:crotonobetainyl-CoA:carnitine CoA-transferase CaiB-like acyl-CoA transferase